MISRTHALVVAAGEVPDRAELDARWPGWADDLAFVIAADGGAVKAERNLGLRPDLVVGDADSIAPAALARLRGEGVPVELVDAAKDESDTELAVLAALQRGAEAVTIVGALGGRRFDHALANVGLLGLDPEGVHALELLDATTRVRLVRAPGPDGAPVRLGLAGTPGDLVSLLPVGDGVVGVTTSGLRYPLRDEPLPFGPARGLSNVRLAADALLVVRRGFLLIVETSATERGEGGTP